MSHFVWIWTAWGATGGGLVGVVRAGSEAGLLATAGEFALSGLVHGLLGAAVGAAVGLVLVLLALVAREEAETADRLRSGAVLMPAVALALMLRAALSGGLGTSTVPVHGIFLMVVLLVIGLGSLITLRSSARTRRVLALIGVGAAGIIVVLSGTRIAAYSSQSLPARVARAAMPADAPDRPSVILLSVDTLRPDYLGLNGGPATTPAIDAFAEESFVFTRARATSPWTRPSFATFHSGLYPSQMGVARLRGEDRQWEQILPAIWRDDADLLAERLGDAGWATGAITTNPHLSAWTNAGQGFDVHYDMMSDAASLRRRLLAISPLVYLMPESSLPYGSALPLQRADRVSEATLEMLRRLEHRPLLLWSHYMDPHAPYDPPGLSEEEAVVAAEISEVEAGRSHRTAAERTRFTRSYAAEIEYFDRWLGRVIDQLKSNGLWDSSIVVLWSDHGEEFWEHGGWEHGQSFYDELLHVPLMVHMPGQTDGQTFDQPVSLLDMMPTLLDLCDLPVTEDLQGRSVAPILRGEDYELEDPRFFLEACHRGETRKGLVFEDHKLIYHVYQDRFELYDLARDPGEQHNIFGTDDAPDTEHHREALRDFTEASFASMQQLAGTDGATELTPEARQQMKDLGYIQ
jgi:arylsulfatase A-like enzyme